MKYTPVFTIEIEHDYFSESKPNLFRIVPTTETKSVLSGAGLLAKFHQNKLYVLAKHIDVNTPLLNLQNNFKLQFFIEVIGFDFSQITNYSVENPYQTKLFFSNTNSIINGNEKTVDDTLYLNEKLPQFSAANAYKYNDLVRSGSDIAYECLVKIDANTGALNNSSQFRQLEKVSYVSNSTSLSFTSGNKIYSLNIPSATVDIKYFQFNPTNNLFDIELKHTVIGPLENPSGELLQSVALSFTSDNAEPFAEGIYKVVVNGEEALFYLRPQNDWQSYLGLINIHNDEFATIEKYRFLREDGTFYTIPPANTEVDTRAFKIRFAPAQYLIKYICKSDKVTNISDDDGNIEFDDLGGNVFQSKRPVRMKDKSIDTITVAYDGSDDLKKTKTPGYRKLSILEDENKYLVSETFLNL